MDPYIPPVSSGSSAGESEGAEEAKRQERQHEKMQAFKQAIERSRVVNEQVARVEQTAVGTQGKMLSGRRILSKADSPDVELPEGAELPEGFAELKSEMPAATKAQTPQAAIDPTYRQALLRMQAEGIPLPPSLLELLEQTEGGKQQKLVAKSDQESVEQVEIAAQEISDPAAELRRAQAKGAASSGADGGGHSGSGSAGKSKKDGKADGAENAA